MAKENMSKRPLKNEPKLRKELNEEQKGVISNLYLYPVTFVEGIWGTGKTFSAVAAAIKAFRKKEINKIVVTRAFIHDKLGALPGDVNDKLLFEMQPIIDNFNELQGKEETEKMIREGTLVIQYNGKVKGMTMSDCIFIIDETQDLTYNQFVELLTRLGKNSKMICTLSKEQVHNSIGKETCYHKLSVLKHSGLVGWNELTANHRHDIINVVIDYIKNNYKEPENQDIV